MEKTPHVHSYDAQGRQLCCTLEEKIDLKTGPPPPLPHSGDDGHDHDHEGGAARGPWREYLPAILSLVLLLSGIALDQYIQPGFFKGWLRSVWYLAAYLPVGLPVLKEALQAMGKGEFFTEFLLMSIATVGAFAIGEYPEGVAVMLFYAVGELFQTAAVRRAKSNIKALLDVRPDTAEALKNGAWVVVKPDQVEVGDTVRVKPGGRVPLDGVLLGGGGAAFNTAALTGESKPTDVEPGGTVLAGSIAADKMVEIRVSKPFGESSIARILDLVQNATARKAPTELFIRKFAKIYTPIVVLLAALLVIVPYFVVPDYSFETWLYRALIFLVISCPCALVISIPLGYFGGIGAASRNGILFKGSNFLDAMTKINTLVTDKTGTLTKGVFAVQRVAPSGGFSETELLRLLASLETASTHPVAKAVVTFAEGKKMALDTPEQVEEISGHGLKGQVTGKTVLAGNDKLMAKFRIAVPPETADLVDTVVLAAVDGQFAGYLTIADEIKEDAAAAIRRLHDMGVRRVVMLSGDKQSITSKIARVLGIDQAFGDLLPEGKVEKVEALKRDPATKLAFVGDGINDAPVLALADVGIAMGGLGSDAAIETADVVIQTDQPSKIATAISIGKATTRVVWQNIGLAFGVKVIVLILGAGGLATMWEAVFADVGVALLAILNAVRVQRMQFF
ncbi:MAG: heavy metal translocating P-type ATPase [Saprospiraceae bacterium]|jgi:Cd2+/Zn2+-exporting ATPase|nr:cadmium-translocating P-type ATPase [Lewinellaceae bacterium]